MIHTWPRWTALQTVSLSRPRAGGRLGRLLRRESGALGIPRDELDVLDAAALETHALSALMLAQ